MRGLGFRPLRGRPRRRGPDRASALRPHVRRGAGGAADRGAGGDSPARRRTRGGLDTSKIMSVTGDRAGDVLEFPEFTLRVIHGFHAELGHPGLQQGLQALIEARRVWEPRPAPGLRRGGSVPAAAARRSRQHGPGGHDRGHDVPGHRHRRLPDRVPEQPRAGQRRRSARSSPPTPAVTWRSRAATACCLVRRQLKEATMPLVETYTATRSSCPATTMTCTRRSSTWPPSR